MERLAARTTIGLGLLALTGIKAALHAVDWIGHQAKGNTVDWKRRYPAHLAHVSAVPLDPEVLYEGCPCENGTPCLRCFDELLIRHEC